MDELLIFLAITGIYIVQNTMVRGGGEKAGWGKKMKMKSSGKKIKKEREKGRKNKKKKGKKKGRKLKEKRGKRP